MLRGSPYRAYAIATVCLISLSTAHAQHALDRRSDIMDVGGSCTVNGTGFRLFGSWSRSMTVQSGSPCGGTFIGPSSVTLKRLNLIAAPQHGKIQLQEGGHYHYTSAAGYHGPDSFLLQICGIGARGESCGELRYSVTVQ
jgi:hypothetical protein